MLRDSFLEDYRDGKITEDQFAGLLGEPGSLLAKHGREFFKFFDTDKSGALDFFEYKRIAYKVANGNICDKPFRFHDLDGDGFVDLKVLTRYVF